VIEERDFNVHRLHESGPARNGEFLTEANAVGSAWQAVAAKDDVEVQFGQWECYAAGCSVNIVHSAAGTIDKVSEDFTRVEPFQRWHSSKFRSGPIEQSDGRIEITWILDAPLTRPSSSASSGPGAAVNR
jgi:hypothetical protein